MSLPYWGSKKKLAKRIVDILSLESKDRHYYEPFCGMASVGMEVLRRGGFVSMTWTDVDPNVAWYWKGVQRGWLPSTKPISQAQWDELRSTSRMSMARCFYGFFLGWGGHFLLGRKPCDRNNEQSLRNVKERLREAAKLMQNSPLTIENAPFASLKPHRNSVIYCDPPYMLPVGKANVSRHFTNDEMMHLWQSIRRWLRSGCLVFLSASELPDVPDDLSITVVHRCDVLNSSSSIRAAQSKRAEYLLRVSLGLNSIPSTEHETRPYNGKRTWSRGKF